jgi:acyl-coenzyme A synthetase/AMP-(fatty) acid ligase
LCGGEALPRNLASDLLRRAGEVWNVYGPTETTIWSSAWRVEAGEGVIAIGRPIANTQLWVLDAKLNPMPVGVPGELYIGGEGLAQGYWESPDLTAERFVRDPFSGEAGSRLYRTGDLARRLPDGRLECLGRIDRQVKLRGFRIELGEIEANIAQHPAVRNVVVVAREEVPGDKRLVAYVVVADSSAGLTERLRGHIRAALPEYMVPAQFVMLDALPLSANGKVDHRALPAPNAEDAASRACAVPPRTATEELVMGVFREVLDGAEFGVLDNFFDLGGHSMMAARLMIRLHAASGICLPLRNLFERPTVAGLAEIIDGLSWLAKAKTISDGAASREEVEL